MAQHARTQRTLKTKLAATGAVVTAGAALLSGGIYAGWSSVGTVDQGLESVDLSAGFVETGGGDSVFDQIGELWPGDHWTRYATLANTGSVPQVFTVKVDTLEDRLTEPADGMRVALRTCQTPFVEGHCEAGDSMPDGEGGWVLDPDDDSVEVLAESWITDAGIFGANVPVGAGSQVFFEVDYRFAASDGAQPLFQGQADTAVLTARSLTAGASGTDRTDG